MGLFKKKSAGAVGQSSGAGSEPCIDIAGNVYKTVKLGSQLWMVENLKVTRYRNGDEIPEVTGDSKWENLKTGARCVYDNKKSNAETYGYLYNWYAAVDKRNIAPEGWRVPTDDDWKALEMALGMSRSDADKEVDYSGSPVGSKLAGNASLWAESNLKDHAEFGTSGFSALPAGYRNDYLGDFSNLGSNAYFWSGAEDYSDGAWFRFLDYFDSGVTRGHYHKRVGFSIRLVRE